MSSKPTTATKRSSPSAFTHRRAKAASQHLTSEAIAADIAAFKKRGGSIEVLGDASYRSRFASTTSHSNVKSSREATTAAASTAAASKNAARG